MGSVASNALTAPRKPGLKSAISFSVNSKDSDPAEPVEEDDQDSAAGSMEVQKTPSYVINARPSVLGGLEGRGTIKKKSARSSREDLDNTKATKIDMKRDVEKGKWDVEKGKLVAGPVESDRQLASVIDRIKEAHKVMINEEFDLLSTFLCKERKA